MSVINNQGIDFPENHFDSQFDYREGAIFIMDKPLQWTSFDVVNKIRYKLTRKFKYKKLKVGHAGTLDPLATGLLIICTGKATRVIEKIQGADKEYIATIELGKTTPSSDLETEIDATYPVKHISKELLKEVMKKFKGEIEQVPPMFSAKKKNGIRAYELARKGIEITMQPVHVRIETLELTDFQPPHATFRVICSKGTYIRALARDIGLAAESGAYLKKLTRTSSGPFKIDKAITINEFENQLNRLE